MSSSKINASSPLDRTRRLQEITAALSRSLTPMQIADVFVRQGLSGVGAVTGSVFVLTTGRMLERIGTAGYEPSVGHNWGYFSIDVSAPISDSVRTGEAIWMTSVEQWYAAYPNVPVSSPLDTAWAAVPLIAGGSVIGCISLTFRETTLPTEDDKTFVVDLALQCAQALDRAQLFTAERRAYLEAEAERTRLDTILDTISDGFISLDSDWRCTYVNRSAAQIVQRPAAELLGQVIWELFPNPPFIFLDDIRLATQGDETEYEQFEPALNRWLRIRIYPTTVGVTLYLQDITRHKHAEQARRISETRFNHFMDANVIGIIIASDTGDIYEANDRFLQTVGYTRDDLKAGRIRWTEMTPPEYAPLDKRALDETLRTGATSNYEKEYFRKDGSRVPIMLGGVLIEHTWTTFVLDLSETKRAEHGLRLLNEASAVLASSLDYQSTLVTVAQLAVPHFSDWCTVHILEQDGSVQQLVIAHQDPAKIPWAKDLQRRYPADPSAPRGLYQVIRTGQAELYAEITEAMLVAAAHDASQLQDLRKIGYTSLMIVPLTVRGRTLGAMQLISTESRHKYTPNDLALAEDLARRAATAVDNARLYSEMREQRERLRVTLASIGDAVIATDAQAQITFINEVALNLTGWSISEALGADFADVFRIVDATTRQTTETPVTQVLREGLITELTRNSLLIARDGRETLIEDSGAPIRNEDGTVDGVILVFRDVTERKRAENAQSFLSQASVILAASLDYTQTLNNVTSLIVPFLADWGSIHMLQPDQTIYQAATAPGDSLISQRAIEVLEYYPPDVDNVNGIGHVIRSGQSELYPSIANIELAPIVQHNQAQSQEISVMIVPLIARGRILGSLTLIRTQPERHFIPADLVLAEEAARRMATTLDNAQLYQQAQTAISDRNEFLSVAAHELKTPITSLRGFTQRMLRRMAKQRTAEPEQLQVALEAIDKQSDKLSKLVGQLLDVARFESGQLVLEKQAVDLVSLVREVTETIQLNVPRHTIQVHTPPSLLIQADPIRLEQVLINLLDNAVKYSPGGGEIEVRLEALPSLAQPSEASLTVTDHGMGIPPEHRDQLFNRFYQAHQKGYLGGMGLGLYVSRQIVELHEGHIEAEFPEEGGARFIIRLPLVAS